MNHATSLTEPRPDGAGAPLYNRRLLALAVELAKWPHDPALPLQAERRAPVCGSMVKLGLSVEDGRIDRIGLDVTACAMGQASAAILARHAAGRSAADVAPMAGRIAEYLDGSTDSVPDWPDFDALVPARAFSARHGSILLPWRCAAALLDPDAAR